jgi:endonuclease G
MRLVYPWVDLHPDRRLRSVYSGIAFDADELIRADAEIERQRTLRLQELVLRAAALGPPEFNAAFEALEEDLPFNCEHVVPQSSFGEDEPMRGDVHHLFACEARCNSFRGNTPYFEFHETRDAGLPAPEDAEREDCGQLAAERFEPVAGKGPVARATLYFLLRYPGVVGDVERELERDRLPILLDWHGRFPVDEYERHRNMAIFEIQGNRNPLIDHPEWAERIAFERGFG